LFHNDAKMIGCEISLAVMKTCHNVIIITIDHLFFLVNNKCIIFNVDAKQSKNIIIFY